MATNAYCEVSFTSMAAQISPFYLHTIQTLPCDRTSHEINAQKSQTFLPNTSSNSCSVSLIV